MGEVLRRAAGYLAERGCDTPRLDAELLLADTLGVERLALYTDHERPLTHAETDRYRDAIGRRGRREPVAYITGRRAFRRIDLAVDPGVLVPRPETELLVEWAAQVAPDGGTVVDWGTGSGAIALALADERPDLTVIGLDVSDAALAVATANDPGGLVRWVRSDGLDGLGAEIRPDVVVANPPYLSEADLAGAPPELAHEPRGALVAGPTGLEALRRIVAETPARLAPTGWLLCEVGAGQADAVAGLMRAAGLADVAARADLAGIDRAVGGRRA